MKQASLIILLISLTNTQVQDPKTLLGLQIIKKPHLQQCYKIPNIGNPIKLLKASIKTLNEQLAENSNSSIRLIFQRKTNRKYTYIFKFKNYQTTDYIGIVYKDSYNDGVVKHQIMSEDLGMINRALNLNVYDNNGIDCDDFKCIWNGNCVNNDYCKNCPYCKGCQGFDVCNNCRNCYECPQCSKCFNRGNYGFDDFSYNNDNYGNLDFNKNIERNFNKGFDNLGNNSRGLKGPKPAYSICFGCYDCPGCPGDKKKWGILGASPDIPENADDENKNDDNKNGN